MSDLDHIDLGALLKRLHLATVARVLSDFEQRAAAESWTHREFLVRLMAEEVANRSRTRVTRLSRRAHTPRS
jgi:DNA replication protein DnaC